MEQFIEKLIGRLEEEKQRLRNLKNNCIALSDHEVIAIEEGAYNFCKNIANELAEEYKGGWIPCSERLPEKKQRCIVSYKGNMSVGIEVEYVDIDTFDGKRFNFFGIDRVIAWQPLPKPYKEGK